MNINPQLTFQLLDEISKKITTRQVFHHSLKEHAIFSKTVKFVCKTL